MLFSIYLFSYQEFELNNIGKNTFSNPIHFYYMHLEAIIISWHAIIVDSGYNPHLYNLKFRAEIFASFPIEIGPFL